MLLIMCTFICRPDWSFIKGETYPVSGPYLRMPCISLWAVVRKSSQTTDVETGGAGGRECQVQVPHFINERRTGIQRERGTSLWSHEGMGESTEPPSSFQCKQARSHDPQWNRRTRRLSLKAHAPGEPASPLLLWFH